MAKTHAQVLSQQDKLLQVAEEMKQGFEELEKRKEATRRSKEVDWDRLRKFIITK
jgi:hypothetical protein